MEYTSANSISAIKAERDRYVAFAFSAADILIELDAATRKVTYVSGALGAVLGTSVAQVIGRPVLDFVTPSSRPAVAGILRAIGAGRRIEPSMVRVRGKGGDTRMLTFGYRLPDMPERLFLSMRVAPQSMSSVQVAGVAARGLMGSRTFGGAATARLGSGELMTLVEIENLGDIVEGLDEGHRQELDEAIAACLMANSVGGDAAADFGNGRFAVLHEKDLTSSQINERVAECAAATSGQRAEVQSASIELAWEGLSEADAAKALVYSIQRFARGPDGDMTVRGLKDGLKIEVRATARRMQVVRDMIEANGFEVHYQPIVELGTRRVRHYEALLRFPEGSPDTIAPYEFVRFAEEVGLIAELDMAMTRRVLDLIVRGAAENRDWSIAVNISGRSLDQADFRESIFALGERRPDLARRLVFEITESMALADLDAANAFLQQLRKRGHKVCLDDFGTGASAFEYLRTLDIDIVKIDGSYIRDASKTEKGADFVRAITALCRSLGVETVAEMVETEDVVKPLIEWGIVYGQGYLFGKPSADIESFEEPRAGWIVNPKRKGVVETWQ